MAQTEVASQPEPGNLPKISAISGWFLDYIVALDVHLPGTAGDFFRASAERRQVVAACLSTKLMPSCPYEAAELAKFIGSGGHRELLMAAFGSIASGIRRALRCVGMQPQPRSFYRVLHQLLTVAGDSNVGRAIRQLDALDLMRLRIAQTLPEDVCTADIIKLVGSVRMATDVAKLINLMTDAGIDRAALAQALRTVRTDTQLAQFWDRWTQKLPFPAHPVQGTMYYLPITSGAELRRLALRYRNCARRYLPQVLDENDAFAEFVYQQNSAVIHLHKDDDCWALEGMFAKDNGRIDPALRAAAVHYLSGQGIRTSLLSPEKGEWSVLRRLSGFHQFGF